jgi:hypothetical protein
MWVLLVILALLLWAMQVRENYEEYQDEKNKVVAVTRPSDTAVWKSKIEAEAPLGSNDADYIKVLQDFYDKVYHPAATKPKDTDIEAFLKTPDAQIGGVDQGALRKMIASSFHTERTVPSAAREDAGIKFQPDNAILQPTNARDEVYTRDEETYRPADPTVKGKLPEGIYEPPIQQETPRRSGEYSDRSTGWRPDQFYSVCEGEDCAKNVL